MNKYITASKIPGEDIIKSIWRVYKDKNLTNEVVSAKVTSVIDPYSAIINTTLPFCWVVMEAFFSLGGSKKSKPILISSSYEYSEIGPAPVPNINKAEAIGDKVIVSSNTPSANIKHVVFNENTEKIICFANEGTSGIGVAINAKTSLPKGLLIYSINEGVPYISSPRITEISTEDISDPITIDTSLISQVVHRDVTLKITNRYPNNKYYIRVDLDKETGTIIDLTSSIVIKKTIVNNIRIVVMLSTGEEVFNRIYNISKIPYVLGQISTGPTLTMSPAVKRGRYVLLGKSYLDIVNNSISQVGIDGRIFPIYAIIGILDANYINQLKIRKNRVAIMYRSSSKTYIAIVKMDNLFDVVRVESNVALPFVSTGDLNIAYSYNTDNIYVGNGSTVYALEQNNALKIFIDIPKTAILSIDHVYETIFVIYRDASGNTILGGVNEINGTLDVIKNLSFDTLINGVLTTIIDDVLYITQAGNSSIIYTVNGDYSVAVYDIPHNGSVSHIFNSDALTRLIDSQLHIN